MAEGLNLNNEVVKMRKEVKRVRALVIRKLTRQISSLRKRKGSEEEAEQNRRRAQRLLDEIHHIKGLKPDHVTKAALQKSLSFQAVCQNPAASLAERATARIASHPQFNKKIQDIKAAVRAFKEERRRGPAAKETPSGPEHLPPQSRAEEEGREDCSKENPHDVDEAVTMMEVAPPNVEVTPPNVEVNPPIAEVQLTETSKANGSNLTPPTEKAKPILPKERVKPAFKERKSPIKQPTASEKSNDSKPETMATEGEKVIDEGSGEVEDSGEEVEQSGEKEYFDDSTEERFLKQSSLSDESDGDDDFFLGKVKRLKKRKSDPSPGDERKAEEGHTRAKKLQSLFCTTLSGPGPRQKPLRSGPVGPPHLREREKDPDGWPLRSRLQKRGQGERFSGARGKGGATGRGNTHVDRRPPPSHHAQQAIHPSWEASRKRKEQQAQITAFQGKKITFSDDD